MFLSRFFGRNEKRIIHRLSITLDELGNTVVWSTTSYHNEHRISSESSLYREGSTASVAPSQSKEKEKRPTHSFRRQARSCSIKVRKSSLIASTTASCFVS
jgi:hypothetical protein